MCYTYNSKVEALVTKSKKMWETKVVNTHKKLNTHMKNLLTKLKKHGIFLTNLKKLKFVEFKGTDDLNSLIEGIRMCSVPMLRCSPWNLDRVNKRINTEFSKITEYYNKRIHFLSHLLLAIESI